MWRVYQECEANRVKVEFKPLKTGFSVVFYRKELPEVETPGLGEKLGEKLGETEVKILKMILINKFVTTQELSESIGISTTAIENNIKKLKEKGLLKRIGPDKGGYWDTTHKS